MAIEPLPTATAPRARPRRPTRTAALLELDPDLGAALGPDRFALARAELVVRILSVPRGEWARDGLSSISRENVGLLMFDGVIAHEVVLEDTVSTELLGAGDLLRPWAVQEEPQLLGNEVRWQVLADAHLAVLGRSFGLAAVRFPEVNAALMDRLCTRAQRLATTQAISHLNSVDRRLLALFWHLAERWGRVTADGVVVPLTLSHRLLAEIIGARRPTVTTALRALASEGKLVRREDATWLLTGDAPGAPAEAALRVVSHRRKLFAPHMTGAHPASVSPH